MDCPSIFWAARANLWTGLYRPALPNGLQVLQAFRELRGNSLESCGQDGVAFHQENVSDGPEEPTSANDCHGGCNIHTYTLLTSTLRGWTFRGCRTLRKSGVFKPDGLRFRALLLSSWFLLAFFQYQETVAS